MLSIYEILSILFVHWFADFLFQDSKWAENKSKDNKALLAHTLMYSVIFTTFGMLWASYNAFFNNVWISSQKVILFGLITFVVHSITDYFTSRIVAKKFAKKEYGTEIPNKGAFTIIGIDQYLHYAQLFITYLILR